MNRFKTVEAEISGAIVGTTWLPQVQTGIPFRAPLKGTFGAFERFSTSDITWRDVVSLLLSEKGGDFQNPLFSRDTVVRIVRRRVDGNGQYTVHVFERELADLSEKWNVADYVDADAYTGDYLD